MRSFAAIAIAGTLGVLAKPATSQSMRIHSVTRAIGTEKLLTANIDFGGGSVLVQPNTSGLLYSTRLRYDADRFEPAHTYDIPTSTLRLGLRSIGGIGIKVTSRAQLEQSGVFEFSPDVPLSLTANLGASQSVLSLGGLTLRDLSVHSGASHTVVTFLNPTKGVCSSATFTVGATDLDIQHLAQSGCSRVRIEGGVGSVEVDFSGTWRSNTDMVVELAMGTITLVIPKGTGVRIDGQRFLSPITSPGFTQNGNQWVTPGFEQSPRQIQVQLKTTLAGIAVKWQ